MEYWVIICKLILLVYLACHYIQFPANNIPLVVFSILLYMCLNLLLYIIKQKQIYIVVLLVGILQIIVSYYTVDPLFSLLFPINFSEIGVTFSKRKWPIFVLAFIPVFWLGSGIRYQYGLAAAFCFMTCILAKNYSEKLGLQEEQLDEMRKSIYKLSQSLHNNEEFIRQSEYTYKLEERSRLSQLFHDNIGHTMTSGLIQMEAAKRLLNTDQEKAQELLQNAINISKSGIENIRVTLKNLKPPVEQLGIQRIKLLIEEFSSKHQIQTPFVYKGNIDIIKPIQWKMIQENLVEAMTNALKYSEATIISTEIQVLNSLIKVEVKDNGVGALKVKKGLGIIGMEERTAAIDGKIIIDGTNGFSVNMLFPITNYENQPKK